MTKANVSPEWAINENNEIVTSVGSGTYNPTGYISGDRIPVDSVGRLVLAGVPKFARSGSTIIGLLGPDNEVYEFGAGGGSSSSLFDVTAYGAVLDGNSHPASSLYTTLAALLVDYPFALSLNDEMDVLGIQKAIIAAGDSITGGKVLIPAGRGICTNANTFSASKTGGATSAVVTNVGSGYTGSTALPTAVGLPSGVTGMPVIENGKMVDYIIKTTGTGITCGSYNITFTGGGGSGATITIYVSAYYTIELPPHSTKRPGIGNSSKSSTPLHLTGDGFDVSQLYWPNDPGYRGATAIKCGRRWTGGAWSTDNRTYGQDSGSETSTTLVNQAMYDMTVEGISLFDSSFDSASVKPVPKQTSIALGAYPSYMTMFKTGSRTRLRECHICGGFAGVDFTGDQSLWEYVVIDSNYYNVYFSKGSSNQYGRQLYGDHTWVSVKLLSAKWAACGVAVGGAMLSIHMHGCGFFQVPFGCYKETGTVAGVDELFISSCTFGSGFQFENIGNCMIFEEPTSGALLCSIANTDFNECEFAFGPNNTYKYQGALPGFASYNYGRWAHIIVGSHTGVVNYRNPNTALIKFNNMDVIAGDVGVGYAPPPEYLPSTFTGSRSNTFPTFFYCNQWENVSFEGNLNEPNSNLPPGDFLFYNLANGGSVSGQSAGYFISPWTGQTNLSKIRVKSATWEGKVMQCMQTLNATLTTGMAMEFMGGSNGCFFVQPASSYTNKHVVGVLMQFGVFRATPIVVATKGDFLSVLTTASGTKIAATYNAALNAGVLELTRTSPGYGYVPGSPPVITVTGLSANNLTFTPVYDFYGGIVSITINGTNSGLTGTPSIAISVVPQSSITGFLVKSTDLGKADLVRAAYAVPVITAGVLTIAPVSAGAGYKGTEIVTLVGLTSGSVTVTPTISSGTVTGYTINGTNSGLAATSLSLDIEVPLVRKEQLIGDVVNNISSSATFARIRC